MLGMSGIHLLEFPSGNPSLWTAQAATTFSKLAKDIHVRHRTFSESHICKYPRQARCQTWTNSKFCLWKHRDNKPISSLRVFVTEEDQTKSHCRQSWVTPGTHLSQGSPDKNIMGLQRASQSSCKTKGNRHSNLILLSSARLPCDRVMLITLFQEPFRVMDRRERGERQRVIKALQLLFLNTRALSSKLSLSRAARAPAAGMLGLSAGRSSVALPGSESPVRPSQREQEADTWPALPWATSYYNALLAKLLQP